MRDLQLLDRQEVLQPNRQLFHLAKALHLVEIKIQEAQATTTLTLLQLVVLVQTIHMVLTLVEEALHTTTLTLLIMELVLGLLTITFSLIL
jgi:hypothetical protein